MGFHSIAIQLDFRILVNELLSSTPLCMYPFGSIVDEVRYYASFFDSFTFDFASRLVNTASHVVTRDGLTGRHSWLLPLLSWLCNAISLVI